MGIVTPPWLVWEQGAGLGKPIFEEFIDHFTWYERFRADFKQMRLLDESNFLRFAHTYPFAFNRRISEEGQSN
jgi:hypothetical protein